MPSPADRGRRSGPLPAAAVLAIALVSAGCARDTDSPAAERAFPATSAAVLLDGALDEWETIPRIIEDPLDAETAGVDIRWVSATDDPAWLYLAFDIEREVNALRMPGAFHFLIDADGDASTGSEAGGLPGADLVVEVSTVQDPDQDPRGLGAAVRAVRADGVADAVRAYALDVVVAPTWSASRFEMRIARGGAPDVGLPPLGPSIRVRAVYSEAGRVMDETDVSDYTFATVPGAPAPGTGSAARLARRDGAVRVAQLNVSSDSFTNDTDAFARLLGALEPDVLLLDELPRTIDDDALHTFFDREPLASLGAWSFVLGRSGLAQRAVVAARDLPLREARELRDVRHRGESLEALRSTLPGAFASLLDYEEEAGIPASGAWITLPGGDVLFAAIDLVSRGYADSPRDRLRAAQAMEVRNRVATEVRAARAASGVEPAVVIGGDFNLVGSRVPMRLLSTRLYADETTLTPVDAERIGERTLATWRDPRQPFTPGRLDFLLTPPAKLDVVNAFVFATEDLDDTTLGVLGLERELSGRIADHLVVVADVRVR